MIRIKRPPKAPDILQGSGRRENESNCELYDRHSDEYHSHSKTFKFKSHIYAHDSVKNVLLEAQHNKCCYCESKFRANYPGDVEHFRPKGAVQQEKSEQREYPGYYWLAYAWENLLVSCYSCNSTQNKGALFPLSDPKARARSHRDELADERPLLIDPASEDPREHIRFRGSACEAIPERGRKSERGRETIRVLGLNRSNLEEDRRKWLDILKNRQRKHGARRKSRWRRSRAGTAFSGRCSSSQRQIQFHGAVFSRAGRRPERCVMSYR